jgi:LCP family protein required for cell wall assembly
MNNGDDYSIDTDPEFNENFYKNIEKALSGADEDQKGTDESAGAKKEEYPAVAAEPSDASDIGDTEDELGDKVDDALSDINASLAKQICEELESMDTGNIKGKKKKAAKSRKIMNGVLIVLVCLLALASFLGFTKPGNQLLLKMGINLGGKLWANLTNTFDKNPVMADDQDYLDEDDLASNAKEIDPNTIVWPEHPGEGRHEDGVYNILLLGEEAIGSGSGRGRTDVILIATMNTNTKKLKLTSLMRDTLVQIPGYKENKLNSAYEKGGLDLLYETIAVNYNIKLDGCVMVNFESFEKIIDKLGGVEIALTKNEAYYLNHTNYISNPDYRTVVEGKQLMNGNQALGYARVRKRANINGTNNDYGRTERHRIILDAIFQKYKTKSKVELASMMLSMLSMITTDINSENFTVLLNNYLEMGTTEIEQLRLPADGTFTDNVRVRGMDVLIPDWAANLTLLQNFIFEDYSTEDAADTDSTTVAATN